MNNLFTLNKTLISSITLYIIRLITFSISTYFIFNNLTIILLWEIFSCWNSTIYFPIILDPLGILFSSTVLFISANVIKFSETYIKSETFNTRFTHIVLLFIISINILIFFPHLITLLLGWDGLGLVSFILVIFYQNPKSLRAGIITALTNRIGDATLILAIAWTINSNNWFITSIWTNQLYYFTILSILIAAITKRAQIPFSRWLPAAIAAPTPVSALVHSSTLVTAGVFLLIRFYPFLEQFKLFNTILLISSSLTIFIAGLTALSESDLKKIIALSTLRQLGVIIARLAIGFPKLAFFHLITHALFKALLFICAGSIIDFILHNQDLRLVGNLTQQIPITTSSFLVANISLCGLPFLSGFYSKDLILETSLFFPTNWIISLLLFTSTAITIIYSLRLSISIIWSPTISGPAHSINNNDPNIFIPTTLLSIGAIFLGSILNWTLIPIIQESFLPSHIKTLPLLVTLIGFIFVWIIFVPSSIQKATPIIYPKFHEPSLIIWYLTPLSTQALLPLPIYSAHHLQKTLDQGWREILSTQGLHLFLRSASQLTQPLQKNHIIIILNFTLFSAIFIIFLFIL